MMIRRERGAGAGDGGRVGREGLPHSDLHREEQTIPTLNDSPISGAAKDLTVGGGTFDEVCPVVFVCLGFE
jgi:hypothetical protein